MADRDNTRARKTMEILKRRRKVTQLYRAGVFQEEIALTVGVTLRTIASDLAVIRERWLRDAKQDFAARQAAELARLDEIEHVSWVEWQRSFTRVKTKITKRPRVVGEITIDGSAGPMVTTETVTETMLPDGRCLDRIREVIEARCKILGLYAPEKFEQVGDMAQAIERLAKRHAEYIDSHEGSSVGDTPLCDETDRGGRKVGSEEQV